MLTGIKTSSSYFYALLRGERIPGPMILAKIDAFLDCAPEERRALWGSVGRLPPGEGEAWDTFTVGREKRALTLRHKLEDRRAHMERLIESHEPPRLNWLTPGEWPIFLAMVAGMTYKEAALELGVSPYTVHRVQSAITKKLGMRREALAYFYGRWVRGEDD